MQLMARTWYMYELTDSALMVGYLGIATGFTMMPFSLLGGALADRMEKRTLRQIGAIGAGVSTIAMSLLIFAGLIQWWNLMLVTVFFSISIGITMPTRNAIIPALVGSDRMLNAVALNAAFMNLTTIAAPAISGRLIDWVGIGWVYLLMGGLNLSGAFILQFLRPVGVTPRQGARKSVAADMKEGLKYLRSQPLLLHLVLFALVIVLLGMPFQFMLPIFTKEVLGVGAGRLGDLLAFMGIGALIGSLSMASLGNFARKGFVLIALTVLFGASIVLFTFSQVFLLSLFLMLPIGIGQTARMTLNTTLVQQHTDPRMLGRVMAIFMMTIGLHSVGLLPLSALSERFGPDTALALAGVLVVLYALGIGIFKPSLRRIP